MSWLKPRNWFAGRKPDGDGREPSPSPSAIDLDAEEASFSRSAIDSTDVPMDTIFTMRMSDELRALGGRKARTLGVSLGEYMRIILELAVDSHIESVIDTEVGRVIRKRRERQQ